MYVRAAQLSARGCPGRFDSSRSFLLAPDMSTSETWRVLLPLGPLFSKFIRSPCQASRWHRRGRGADAVTGRRARAASLSRVARAPATPADSESASAQACLYPQVASCLEMRNLSGSEPDPDKGKNPAVGRRAVRRAPRNLPQSSEWRNI